MPAPSLLARNRMRSTTPMMSSTTAIHANRPPIPDIHWNAARVMPVALAMSVPSHAPEAWFRDRAALALIGRRYLPWLAALNLAWELAQLPLYTIWREQSAGYVAFA